MLLRLRRVVPSLWLASLTPQSDRLLPPLVVDAVVSPGSALIVAGMEPAPGLSSQ